MSGFTATRRACWTGFVVQAIVNNVAPLLFIVFHTRFSLPVEQLGGLAALNFGVQLVTDFAAMHLVDRIGYRLPLVWAHLLSVADWCCWRYCLSCCRRRSSVWRSR